MTHQIISFDQEQATITYEEKQHIATITINRQHAKNALSAKMWDALGTLANLPTKNPEIKLLVIQGAGRNFTAGSDIKEFHAISLEKAEAAFINMETTISTVEKLPIPVVALLNGPAMGAGLELALACDLRIGTNHTKLGIPVGKLGITLNHKFSKRLVDLIGPSKTKDLVFTGRIYSAEEGLSSGLLNYLVQEDDLSDFSSNLLNMIISMSPDSLKAVKSSVADCLNFSPSEWGTPKTFVSKNDFSEGVAAFAEKRMPQF